MPHRSPHRLPTPSDSGRRAIAVVRAVLALVWAAALVLAIGDDVPARTPTSRSRPPPSWPPTRSSTSSPRSSARRSRAPPGASCASTPRSAQSPSSPSPRPPSARTPARRWSAFGAWAAVSGAIQLGVAVHRRAQGRQLPMIVSGGLSTIAGLGFVVASGMDDARLATLAGYMGLGAVLFLLWARAVTRDGRPPSVLPSPPATRRRGRRHTRRRARAREQSAGCSRCRIRTATRSSSSDYAGKVVVLYFYPRDNTPGCTVEGGEEFQPPALPAFAKAGVWVVLWRQQRTRLPSHLRQLCYKFGLQFSAAHRRAAAR